MARGVDFTDFLDYSDNQDSGDSSLMALPSSPAAIEDIVTDLLTVSAKDVAGKFGFYTDEAMLRPVGIQRHGTTRVVMISLKEYERLKRRDREVILTKDLDDETLDLIRNAKIPDEARRLDYLMGDPAAN